MFILSADKTEQMETPINSKVTFKMVKVEIYTTKVTAQFSVWEKALLWWGMFIFVTYEQINFCSSTSIYGKLLHLWLNISVWEKKFSFPSSLLLDIYTTSVSKSVKKCLDAGVKPDSSRANIKLWFESEKEH